MEETGSFSGRFCASFDYSDTLSLLASENNS